MNNCVLIKQISCNKKGTNRGDLTKLTTHKNIHLSYTILIHRIKRQMLKESLCACRILCLLSNAMYELGS